MSERETHDFMSVDSFSQLPFIRRPAPVREKNSSSAIRLFGIEFPHDHEPGGDDSPSKDHNSTDNGSNANGSSNGSGGGGGGESSRKFECHYCCRNFPTSQALGGHQNAHKRERQHAKRAHLQSAMAAHQAHGGIAEGHVYGLLNYHRLGSIPSSARFGIGHHPFDSSPPPSHYPSWNSTCSGSTSTSLTGPRFYGGPGSVSQPINGSPLPGFWRIPAVHAGGGLGPIHGRDSSAALPLFAGDHNSRAVGGVGGGVSGSSSSLSPSQSRLGYESAAGVQDHLSLDLHL